MRWFDPLTSWFVALVTTGAPWLKEKTTKSIPAEYWANEELRRKDIMSGVSAEELLRRTEAGRYYIPKEVFQAYPTQHTDPVTGQPVIDNFELYYSDILKYDAWQVKKWATQGKYNLTKEENEIYTLQAQLKYRTLSQNEINLHKASLEKKMDWHDTEAVRQWKKARATESKYH